MTLRLLQTMISAMISLQGRLFVGETALSASFSNCGTSHEVARDASTDAEYLVSAVYEGECVNNFCTIELAEDLVQKYRINVPENSTLESCSTDGNCTITFEVVLDGEAWVGVGFSKNGEMIGSDAVIGIPGQNPPLKYSLGGKDASLVLPLSNDHQTLTDANIEVVRGKTKMNFTKLMREDDEVEITVGDNHFLWAHGSRQSNELGYHEAKGSYVLNPVKAAERVIADTNLYQRHWKSHGWLGFVAWGILVPFAINASLLRTHFPTKGFWFRIHQLLNGGAYIVSLTTISVAAFCVQKEGSGHFNGPHKRMGLSIVILASIQVLGGSIRPPKPYSLSSHAKKPRKRVTWEVCHRLLGIALLLCSFWQIASGLHLYDKKFSIPYKNGVVTLYWLWIGLVCVSTARALCLRWNRRDGRERTSSWLHTTEESERLSAHLL